MTAITHLIEAGRSAGQQNRTRRECTDPVGCALLPRHSLATAGARNMVSKPATYKVSNSQLSTLSSQLFQ
jgi:hypothetical protein